MSIRPVNRSGAAGAVLLALALASRRAAARERSGPPNIRWYVFQEPSGAYNDAVANCNEQAGGRYKIELVPLPTSADQQRELVVRRLAAEDSDIDIIGMDVIWTAEFAEAGWIREWTGADKAEVDAGHARGPADAAAPTRTSSSPSRSRRTCSSSGTARTACRSRPRPGTR